MPPSAGEEVEADLTAWIVGVEIHQHDSLPSSQDETATGNREGQGGADKSGQEMVGAVAGAAVPVSVAVVTRKQALERVHQVALRGTARLHESQPGGGVKREDRQQAVATLMDERLDVSCDVDDLGSAGVDGELPGSHALYLMGRCRVAYSNQLSAVGAC